MRLRSLVLALLLLVPSIPAAHARVVETHLVFRATAQRFFFRATRDVHVTARIDDLNGTVTVRLNKPVRARFGIDCLRFRVAILGEDGRFVSRVTGRLDDGESTVEMPLQFPAAGHYRLVLTDSDVEAGAAEVRIRPDGRIHLDVQAGNPERVARH